MQTELPKTSETPYRAYDRIARWPVRHIASTGQFFLEIHPPHLTEGRIWIPVVDVTVIANELYLNQGQIEDGAVVWGPGEAFAAVGSEGSHVYVVLKDGRKVTRRVIEMALDITIPRVVR